MCAVVPSRARAIAVRELHCRCFRGNGELYESSRGSKVDGLPRVASETCSSNGTSRIYGFEMFLRQRDLSAPALGRWISTFFRAAFTTWCGAAVVDEICKRLGGRTRRL